MFELFTANSLPIEILMFTSLFFLSVLCSNWGRATFCGTFSGMLPQRAQTMDANVLKENISIWVRNKLTNFGIRHFEQHKRQKGVVATQPMILLLISDCYVIVIIMLQCYVYFGEAW